MKVLVAGADRVDAGKTTFSTGLVERLETVGYKPRAGNDYWFDHDDYRRAIREGRLYGKDARRLADASYASVEPEDVNPLHRLWRPLPGTATGIVGAGHRRFVLDRVGEEFVVNAQADVPGSARDGLGLAGAETVASVEELNLVTERRYLPALRDLAEGIVARDRAVVESYGDVARPVDIAVDAVAVVEPARVRVYDGDRYGRACEVASGSPREGRLETPVEAVVEPIDPAATVGLPALSSERRADPAAVADAYEVAYDAVLAAAV